MKKYSELKPFHDVVLGVYKKFIKICEEHNIRYYAISGTTLGAVLWNGIIPWDDDIDIALPAEDYKKFVRLCKEGVLPKGLGFCEYIWFGGKLFDRNTTFTNAYYLSDPERFVGVSMDVVPLINIPNDKKERLKFAEELKKFHAAGVLFDRYGILDGVDSKKDLLAWKNYFMDTYKFGETNYVMDFSDHRYILKAKGFENPIIVDFEDVKIPVSSNYDDALTIQYGKYSKYPPEETREGFHQKVSLVDMETPCEVYANSVANAPGKIKKILDIKHIYEGYAAKWINEKNDYIENLQKRYSELVEENTMLKNRLNARRYKLVDKITSPIDKIRSLRATKNN